MTYAVKQVQTSNTVLLLRPVAFCADDDGLPLVRLQAFATSSSTLELQPCEVGSKARSAAHWLSDLLPTWSSSMPVTFEQARNKIAYLDDVPFSDEECDAAWHDFFAFEEDGQAFRPAEKELLDLWRTLKQCVDVTAPFKVEDVFAAMRDSDFPRGMIEAVVVSSLTKRPREGIFSFNKSSTVPWLAKLTSCLSAGVTSVANDLRDILPQEWHATADGLSSANAAAGNLRSLASASAVEQTTTDSKQSSTGAAKRIGKQTNWHEKFKRAKT